MPISGVGSGSPLPVAGATENLNQTVASEASSLDNLQQSADSAMNSAAASGNEGAMLQAQLQEGELSAEEQALSSEIKDKTDVMKSIAQNMAG